MAKENSDTVQKLEDELDEATTASQVRLVGEKAEVLAKIQTLQK